MGAAEPPRLLEALRYFGADPRGGSYAKRFVISWFLIICFDANGSM